MEEDPKANVPAASGQLEIVPTEDQRMFAQSLLKESDRAIGVLGGEFLSQELTDLIRSYCRQDAVICKRFVEPLFVGFGPLSSFSARIQVAFALGIITDRNRIELDLVRKIRNDFAHSLERIDFSEPSIVGRLQVLAGASDSEDDADKERRLIGELMMTKRQFIDRLAFALKISNLRGALTMYRETIQAGADIRSVIRHLEARTSSDRE